MKRLMWIVCSVAVIGLTASGCGIPEEEHNKVVAAKKKLERELKEMKALSAQQKQQITQLEFELKKVKQQMGSEIEAKRLALQQKLAELAKTKQALEELEKIKAEMEAQRRLDAQLRAAFQKMISAGQLTLKVVHGRLVIAMASKVLFRSGKARLTRTGRNALQQIARILAKIDRHFQVAGHTDSVPIKRSRYGDNWGLSAQRSVEVVRLLEKEGVPGNRLSAAGFSQFQPVATNKTPDGKQLNRRIEISLLPAIPPQFQP